MKSGGGVERLLSVVGPKNPNCEASWSANADVYELVELRTQGFNYPTDPGKHVGSYGPGVPCECQSCTSTDKPCGCA